MSKTTPSQQPPLCHTHNGITMIRTFHPIGHGAFYTERFMQGGKYKFSAVFDCGCFEARKKGMSYARYTDRINRAVDSVFSPWEKVDLLFISHFHADHINGIKYLTSLCDVKHIIVPQLTPNIVIEAYVFNYIQTTTEQGDNAANSSVNLWIRDLYSHRGNDNTEGFPRVIEVMPATEIPKEQERREGQEERNEMPSTTYSDLDTKGGILSPREAIDYCPAEKPDELLWRYIPFNPPCSNTEQLLNVSPFKEAVVNGNIDFEKLDSILKTTDIKDIKKAYQKAYGNHNSYSMVVFSGIGAPQWWSIEDCCLICGRIRYHRSPCFCMYNCLYCGDFEANADYPKANNNCDKLRRFFRKYWREIGLLQVPHHGSEHNMNISLYEPEKVCIISAGETDKYGHPDEPVLEAIRQMNSIPIIVTENPKTKQEFTYPIW